MKVDEEINKYKKDIKLINSNEDYESDLRKEEAAIRKHISIQHQMKLYIDKIEEKLENYEKSNKLLIKKIDTYNENKKNIDNNYNEMIKKLENEKNKLNSNILELKNIIEEKEKKIKILENKLNFSTTNYLSSFYSKDSKNNNSNNTIFFYNQSNNTSMNNNNKSRSYSKNTKKPSKQLNVSDKIDFYQKLVDKKLHDITRNKNTHLTTFREKSISSIESDISSIHKMNDDLTQRLNNISIRILGNEKEKRSFTPNKINSINSNNNTYKKFNKNINLNNNTNYNNLRNNHNLNKKNYLSEFTNILYNNLNNNSIYHNLNNNKNIKRHKRYNSVENNIQMNNDRLSFNYTNNINNNNYNNINNISNMNKYKKQKLSKEVNLRQYLYFKYNSSNINNNKNNNYLINSYKKI